MIASMKAIMTTQTHGQFGVPELVDINSAGADGVIFQVLIADANGETQNGTIGAWASKALGSKSIRVLSEIAASARRHISLASGIPKRHIHPMISTVEKGCLVGLVITEWRSVRPAKLELARIRGAQLADTLTLRIRARLNCLGDATTSAAADTTVASQPSSDAEHKAEQVGIVERFIAAVAATAKTADGGQLRVATTRPGQAEVELLPVKSSDAKPATHTETEPWRLAATLEEFVNKDIMLVRRVDDRQKIRVITTGFPEARLDFRLFQGTGPVHLMVSGKADEAAGAKPTVRLISMVGLDVHSWASHAHWLESLAQRIEVHRRSLEAAGLLTPNARTG